MKKLTIKKAERRPTMCVSIDANLRRDIIKGAKKGGVSISSFVEQIIKFVLSEKEEIKK